MRLKLYTFLTVIFFVNLSCNNPSIVLRKSLIGNSSNRRNVNLEIKFLNRLKVDSYLSKILKKYQKKKRKVSIKKRIPYVSVYSFIFSINNPDIIISKIDSVLIKFNNKNNYVYDVRSFSSDFPEKHYQTKKYLFLFRKFLHDKGIKVLLSAESSLNIRSKERIRGFFVYPRIPYSVKKAEFLIKVKYYRDPWIEEEELIRIPLDFSLFRLKP